MFLSGGFEDHPLYPVLEKRGVVALSRMIEDIRNDVQSYWRIQMCFSIAQSALDQCIWVPPDSHGNIRVIKPRIIEWWDSLHQTN